MIPVFPPKDGQIDADRLRIVFDDIDDDSVYIASVVAGIKAWEAMLDIPIVNLDPGRPASSGDYVILVGKGKQAPEPQKSLERSFVGASSGYFFSTTSDSHTFAHEFGHLLGLADRYYEGYEYGETKKIAGGANIEEIEGVSVTVPMSQSLFRVGDEDGDEDNYDPFSNLMSGTLVSWTISSAQRKLILSGKMETQLPRHVVGVFDSRKEPGPFFLPGTMYLEGDLLKTITDKNEHQPIAGYALLGSIVFRPKAEKDDVKEAVKASWLRRSRVDDHGKPKIKIRKVRKGKSHMASRLSFSAGPRIHRPMMRLIGRLAGG